MPQGIWIFLQMHLCLLRQQNGTEKNMVCECVYNTGQKYGVSAGENIMQTLLQSEQFFFHA